MIEQPGLIYRHSDLAEPRVFVSSTFDYKLLPVRDALRRDLIALGYHPVMSELSNFVFGHGASRVFDDTIAAVSSSQIYVLLIGRRHGSVHPTLAASITELEYMAARREGLPTVAFVSRDVVDGWDLWRSGKVDPSDAIRWVDDTRVWDFVTSVMSEDACPVFPFDDAQSVVQDLHAQLANLFGAFLRFDHGARRWLWTEARTGAAESTAAGVWVLTPDLYWDFQDDEYRELVYNNVVTRRVPYRYLCADTLVNRTRISELQREYTDVVGDAAAELAQFSVVPEDEFVWCTEHVLLNPHTNREVGLIVDICEDRDRSRKYDIEMGRSKRLAFRAQFERLWNRYSDALVLD